MFSWKTTTNVLGSPMSKLIAKYCQSTKPVFTTKTHRQTNQDNDSNFCVTPVTMMKSYWWIWSEYGVNCSEYGVNYVIFSFIFVKNSIKLGKMISQANETVSKKNGKKIDFILFKMATFCGNILVKITSIWLISEQIFLQEI